MAEEKKSNSKAGSRSISVGAKILIPVLVLTIIAVISNLVNYKNMMDMNQQQSSISKNYIKGVDLSGRLYVDIETEWKSLDSFMMAYQMGNTEVATKEYENMKSVQKQKYADLKEYKALPAQSGKTELLNNFEAEVKRVESAAERALSDAKSGNGTQALMNINQTMIPAAEKMESTIKALKDYETNGAEAASQKAQDIYQNARVLGLILLMLMGICFVITIVLVEMNVIKPLKDATDRVHKINETIRNKQGDLTQRIPIRKNDEIGQLSTGINHFLDLMQNIVSKLGGGSSKLMGLIGNVNSSVSTSNDNASEVSAALEELSASMQEVSATVQTVSANTGDIGNEVDAISTQSNEIASYTKEMDERATELANTAKMNKSATNEMLDGLIGTMKKAIDDSKSVDEVNNLTGEILNISSKTNLLALNASIEAARAGEAGKGFAVVADEIRELAESSKETANNIQVINDMVVNAVNSLVENSQQMLDFMQERVLSDYDGFVDSGEQYKADANHINEAMLAFAEKTNSLTNIMNDMIGAIDGIAKASEESAQAVVSSADNTTNLVGKMSDIDKEMNASVGAVNGFTDEINIFTKY
ncbi:MAG: methyl-accepting chemotaxis protein [Lachnospiraceae bacterium]|nr:methyl-accepting chemotaxis protein [Lachnospiraceae bacterium]